MANLIDFDKNNINGGGYHGYDIPDHTRETLERYLLEGLNPGGFVSAMLALDMQRALQSADTANRNCIWIIGRWILEHAPDGSWGSYEQIKFWTNDVGGRRSTYRDKLEKEYVWRALGEKTHA